MVEIKIISGTKDEPPNGHNTRIYVDDKEITGLLSYCWFRVEAEQTAEYCLGMTKTQYSLWYKTKKAYHNIKNTIQKKNYCVDRR